VKNLQPKDWGPVSQKQSKGCRGANIIAKFFHAVKLFYVIVFNVYFLAVVINLHKSKPANGWPSLPSEPGAIGWLR
jgi:hypothetical protein